MVSRVAMAEDIADLQAEIARLQAALADAIRERDEARREGRR